MKQKTVKLLIEIPEETYEYWKEHKYEYVLAEAIANGTPLHDGCEVLTKEAYSDLCLRAAGRKRDLEDNDARNG